MHIIEKRYFRTFASKWHRAKDETAIDDDFKIPGNMQQKDDSDSDSDSVSFIKKKPIMKLINSDGEEFDPSLIRRESQVLRPNISASGTMEVDISLKTLKLVQEFCVGHINIKQKHATCPDKEMVVNELIDFRYDFLHAHLSSAIELVTAGFELELRSVVYPMMIGVDWLMTNDMKEDEVYKLFFVNLKDDPDDDDKFESMKQCLLDFSWALKIPRKKDPTANDYWNPKLLKLKFDDYKCLKSYKQRRQWLTAHFLLRRSPLAYEIKMKKKMKMKMKMKSEGSLEG